MMEPNRKKNPMLKWGHLLIKKSILNKFNLPLKFTTIYQRVMAVPKNLISFSASNCNQAHKISRIRFMLIILHQVIALWIKTEDFSTIKAAQVGPDQLIKTEHQKRKKSKFSILILPLHQMVKNWPQVNLKTKWNNEYQF